MMDCKDIISGLPESLICHILSYLSTKDAALTSLLSKRWRYLFAFTPNLKFDDSVIYLHPEVCIPELDEKCRMFMDFVDRVLGLQGNLTVNNFSLQCQNGVDPDCVTRWITNVIERRVSDLDLRITLDCDEPMPASVFVSESLVSLRIEAGNGIIVDVGDSFLPKLKTLYLDLVLLSNYCGDGLVKLVSSCPVLEELVMINLSWLGYWRRSWSSKTLKRLTFHCQVIDHNPFTVTFDTPNLVYLEYSDHVADEYKKVKFDSLVEASIGLQLTSAQHAHASYGDMVSNAKDLITGISNVRILHLFGKTLKVLTLCCKPIPVFKNLNHLTIMTHWELGWDSLPALLKNCPNLETLVFEGLHHKKTIRCEDVDGCLCKSSEYSPTCLSSSPVKILKILQFGEICDYYGDDMEEQMEQVKCFLEKMPNLEQMILHYDTQIDEDVKSQLQKLVASAKSSVQLILISDNLSVSTNPLVFVS